MNNSAGSGKVKKGILKPLRYISQMFDGKEPEMQIGFPTDVKHVAHIGWDGPNVSTGPAWMKEYHSAPLDSASFSGDRGDSPATNPWASQEIVLQGGGLGDSPLREGAAAAAAAARTERASVDLPLDSPTSTRARRSRRHHSGGGASMSAADSAGGEERAEKRDKAKKGARKSRKKDKEGSQNGSNADDAAAAPPEPPNLPKKSSRRKSKSSEGSGSSTRPKDAAAAAAAEEAPPAPAVAEEKDEGL